MNTHSLNSGAIDLYPTLVEHLQRRSTAVLLSIGILVVVIHAAFRFPLRLPGHHGLEWMALLVLARQMSSYRWAASVAAAGAAASSLLPLFGFHDPFVAVTYLVPGLVLDSLYFLLPQARRNASLLLGVAAALAYATKPLIQWAGSAALGLPFDAWAKGLAYLVAMHMLFAFAGGSVGAALWHRASAR